MKDCTCLGTCKGAAGLGPGWRCALESHPSVDAVAKGTAYCESSMRAPNSSSEMTPTPLLSSSEKNEEKESRVDDTQYDPPAASPSATASENEQGPTVIEVRHCPRCTETHLLVATRLTFTATVYLTVEGKRIAIAHWTHWMTCPTWNEPIFHGLEVDYPNEYGVTIEPQERA